MLLSTQWPAVPIASVLPFWKMKFIVHRKGEIIQLPGRIPTSPGSGASTGAIRTPSGSRRVLRSCFSVNHAGRAARSFRGFAPDANALIAARLICAFVTSGVESSTAPAVPVPKARSAPARAATVPLLPILQPPVGFTDGIRPRFGVSSNAPAGGYRPKVLIARR